MYSILYTHPLSSSSWLDISISNKNIHWSDQSSQYKYTRMAKDCLDMLLDGSRPWHITCLRVLVAMFNVGYLIFGIFLQSGQVYVIANLNGIFDVYDFYGHHKPTISYQLALALSIPIIVASVLGLVGSVSGHRHLLIASTLLHAGNVVWMFSVGAKVYLTLVAIMSLVLVMTAVLQGKLLTLMQQQAQHQPLSTNNHPGISHQQQSPSADGQTQQDSKPVIELSLQELPSFC